MESLFYSLSDTVGMSVDRVKYAALFFLSFPFAFILRIALHYSYTNTIIRHIYSTTIGIYFGWICFKWQIFYLMAFAGIGYIFLLLLPPRVVHKYTMIYALVAISLGHIYRMITDYAGYHLDFTGPLMLMVQKVTYVAFEYHDGVAREDNELNDDQRKQKISAVPSLLEYFSYNFCFFTFLAGPTSTYKEYDDFITGRNMAPAKKNTSSDPSPLIPLLKKLVASLVCLFIVIRYDDRLSYHLILDPSLPFLRRHLNIMIFSFVGRCKYYFAYLIADSVSNAAGLGFNGYDNNGNAKWDLVKNIDVLKMELGRNPREQINAWNITTATWLRRVVYERTTWYPVIQTVIVSAVWHGFYPAYYITFTFIGILTLAARKTRRLIWHHFQEPPLVKLLYDIVTIMWTNHCKDLAQISHTLLFWDDATQLWSFYYYMPYILVVSAVLILPNKRSTKKEKQTELTTSQQFNEAKKNHID